MDGQRRALRFDLIGTYVFGSVVRGDFEPTISDVDTVAVVSSDLEAVELASLERLHRRIVDDMPRWDDRVEVIYVPATALASFRDGSWPAARISPGEPFHAIEVDPDG